MTSFHGTGLVSVRFLVSLALYIYLYIMEAMKPICFLGDSLRRMKDFPVAARQEAAFQKKTQATPRQDIELGRTRYKELSSGGEKK